MVASVTPIEFKYLLIAITFNSLVQNLITGFGRNFFFSIIAANGSPFRDAEP
jgi:hypothetical protein